jgi:hypothetical protein
MAGQRDGDGSTEQRSRKKEDGGDRWIQSQAGMRGAYGSLPGAQAIRVLFPNRPAKQAGRQAGNKSPQPAKHLGRQLINCTRQAGRDQPCRCPMIAAVKSVVPLFPPKSQVKYLPSAIVVRQAFSILQNGRGSVEWKA